MLCICWTVEDSWSPSWLCPDEDEGEEEEAALASAYCFYEDGFPAEDADSVRTMTSPEHDEPDRTAVLQRWRGQPGEPQRRHLFLALGSSPFFLAWQPSVLWMVTLWKEQNLLDLDFWLPVEPAEEEGANSDFFKLEERTATEEGKRFVPVSAASKLCS